MIKPSEFLSFLENANINFFTGVPDSALKEFCNYVIDKKGISKDHIIAPNEGNAVALASGHYLATQKYSLVYMQNSGLGNAVNPITSLIDTQVYAIPMLFLVGWRGKPNEHDEPQHIKQGAIQNDLIELLEIKYYVLTKETTMDNIKNIFEKEIKPAMLKGESYVFVAEKNAFSEEVKYHYNNESSLTREKAISIITSEADKNSLFVCTTGKASRELYEIRENNKETHEKDFLTVGSMGHASMIALKIALEKKDRKVYCIDGDGSLLMHMGSMGLIGANKPKNFVHIILNNGCHETVGGLPTIVENINLQQLALACSYDKAVRISSEKELISILNTELKTPQTLLIEICINSNSREDLGRPKSTPIENKNSFMECCCK